ncbi:MULTISPECIES: PucR family transcriptional regulator [unclassified Streptomyces]|uniref:PucR family transcriptional regulator n=1 Tax=unclassified Streptomyces TaxID=2593676 RepID=UPI0036E84BB8
MTTTSGTTGRSPGNRWGREHLANLYGLFVLSMIMNDAPDESDVLTRALTAVGTLGPCRAEAAYLTFDNAPTRTPADWPHATPHLDAQVRRLGGQGGRVTVPDRAWGWSFALQNKADNIGYLVVSAPSRPTDDEFFLLRVLAQQTAAGLTHALARRTERDRTQQLRRVNDDHAALNVRLSTSVSELERQRSVHETLSQASADDGGVQGIAVVLHRLTGYPVAVEDRFGNPWAWAGPGRPDPYPKPEAGRHEELLQEAARRLRPVRVGERVIALARHRGEILGTVALIDPEASTGEQEEFALDHTCTALTLELAHLRNLAEVELRLRRELVDDLITGTDDESAYARAAAVGHDLHGPHHLAAVQWVGRPADDAFVQAVGRAAAGLRMPWLLARRSGKAVLVLQGRPQAMALHEAVVRELGSPTGAIGVGGRCDTPGEIPRSFQEALRALEVRQRSQTPHGTTTFDELGLYRILGPGGSYRDVEQFVREWLGPLLDYDAAHHADLVRTLSRYFECGGNYDGTAAALGIHRSTLRYRLQRIREVSGRGLADVDSRLNLHVATRVWKVLGGSL